MSDIELDYVSSITSKTFPSKTGSLQGGMSTKPTDGKRATTTKLTMEDDHSEVCRVSTSVGEVKTSCEVSPVGSHTQVNPLRTCRGLTSQVRRHDGQVSLLGKIPTTLMLPLG